MQLVHLLHTQQIVKKCQKGYSILIFGDSDHPEVKGVQSYGEDQMMFI